MIRPRWSRIATAAPSTSPARSASRITWWSSSAALPPRSGSGAAPGPCGPCSRAPATQTKPTPGERPQIRRWKSSSSAWNRSRVVGRHRLRLLVEDRVERGERRRRRSARPRAGSSRPRSRCGRSAPASPPSLEIGLTIVARCGRTGTSPSLDSRQKASRTGWRETAHRPRHLGLGEARARRQVERHDPVGRAPRRSGRPVDGPRDGFESAAMGILDAP